MKNVGNEELRMGGSPQLATTHAAARTAAAPTANPAKNAVTLCI